MRGMAKNIDLTGQRFGRLVVEGFAGFKGDGHARKRKLWACRCDCGNVKEATTTALRSAFTRSCGCLAADHCREMQKAGTRAAAAATYLGPNVALENFLFSKYKGAASRRGITFSLSRESFKVLTGSPCRYCAGPPSQKLRLGRNAEEDVLTYNGIDRIDSSVGYVEGNCVPCCWTCNQSKGTRSVEDFLAWLNRAASHLSSHPVVPPARAATTD